MHSNQFRIINRRQVRLLLLHQHHTSNRETTSQSRLRSQQNMIHDPHPIRSHYNQRRTKRLAKRSHRPLWSTAPATHPPPQPATPHLFLPHHPSSFNLKHPLYAPIEINLLPSPQLPSRWRNRLIIIPKIHLSLAKRTTRRQKINIPSSTRTKTALLKAD